MTSTSRCPTRERPPAWLWAVWFWLACPEGLHSYARTTGGWQQRQPTSLPAPAPAPLSPSSLPPLPPAPCTCLCSPELPPYALRAGAGREVDQLDAALSSVLARLGEHRRRRAMLLSFAQSPVDFITAMVAAHVGAGEGGALGRREGHAAVPRPPLPPCRLCPTNAPTYRASTPVQSRELRQSGGKDGDAFELMPQGEVFAGRWVDDCVMNYMQRKQRAAAEQQQQAAAMVAAQQAAQQQQAAALVAAQAAAAQQQALAAAQQQQAAVAAAAAQQQAAALAAAAAAQQQAAAAAGGLVPQAMPPPNP